MKPKVPPKQRKSASLAKLTDTGTESGDTTPGQSPANKPNNGPRTEEIPGPSPTELAMIAAALRQTEQKECAALACDALSLWESCQTEIQKRAERLARPNVDLFASLPKPKGFPVPFAEFLTLMSPDRRDEDRMKLYRDFLADWYEKESLDLGKELEKHKNDPAFELDFNTRCFLFKAWLDAHVRTQRSIAGSKAHKPTEAQVAALEKDARKECRKAIVEAGSKLGPKWREFTMRLALC